MQTLQFSLLLRQNTTLPETVHRSTQVQQSVLFQVLSQVTIGPVVPAFGSGNVELFPLQWASQLRVPLLFAAVVPLLLLVKVD
jgi:hypothetical protein